MNFSLAPFLSLLDNYPHINRIDNDIKETMQEFNLFRIDVKPRDYGPKKKYLLFMNGTIPISYKDEQFYIPTTIFFDPSYPIHAPQCFVTPTQSMNLVQPHRNVDHNGFIYHPYLTEWLYNSSSLVNLFRELQKLFSAEPPVISKQQPSISQTKKSPFNHLFGKKESTKISELQNDINVKFGDLWPVLTRPILEHIDKQDQNKENLEKMTSNLANHKQLKTTLESQINSDIKDIERITNGLETKISQLESFGDDKFDPISLIRFDDKKSQQILDMTAEIASHEDFIFELDSAFSKGHKEVNEYLRELRENYKIIFNSNVILKALTRVSN